MNENEALNAQITADMLRHLADEIETGEISPWQFQMSMETIETGEWGEYARYRRGPYRRVVFEYRVRDEGPAEDGEESNWNSLIGWDGE